MGWWVTLHEMGVTDYDLVMLGLWVKLLGLVKLLWLSYYG